MGRRSGRGKWWRWWRWRISGGWAPCCNLELCNGLRCNKSPSISGPALPRPAPVPPPPTAVLCCARLGWWWWWWSNSPSYLVAGAFALPACPGTEGKAASACVSRGRKKESHWQAIKPWRKGLQGGGGLVRRYFWLAVLTSPSFFLGDLAFLRVGGRNGKTLRAQSHSHIRGSAIHPQTAPSCRTIRTCFTI